MVNKTTKENKQFCLETSLFTDLFLYEGNRVAMMIESWKRLVFLHNAGHFPKNKSDNTNFVHLWNDIFVDELTTKELDLLDLNEQHLVNPDEIEYVKTLRSLGL